MKLHPCLLRFLRESKKRYSFLKFLFLSLLNSRRYPDNYNFMTPASNFYTVSRCACQLTCFLTFFGLVTPERLCTSDFLQLLDVVYENHNLNRLVVDEVWFPSDSTITFLTNLARPTAFRLAELKIFFVLTSNLSRQSFLGMGP